MNDMRITSAASLNDSACAPASWRRNCWQICIAFCGALSVSLGTLLLLSACEYMRLRYVQDKTRLIQNDVRVTEFCPIDDAEIGFYACRESFEGAEGSPRYRIGILGLARGETLGTEQYFSERISCLATGEKNTGFVGFVSGDIVRAKIPLDPITELRYKQLDKELNGVWRCSGLQLIAFNSARVFAIDSRTFRRLWEQSFDGENILAVEVQGKGVFCATDRGCLRHLDLRSGELHSQWNVEGPIVRLAVAETKELVGVVVGKGKLIIWDTKNDRPLWVRQLKGLCRTTFSPDGERLVIVDDHGASTIQMVHPESGFILSTLESHPFATGAKYSADGQKLFTWGKDGCIRAWSAVDSRLLWVSDLST